MATVIGLNLNGGTNYALSGTLQDGTDINGCILLDNYDHHHFTLQAASVPKPRSIALFVGLGVTGAGFVRKRRSRS